MVKSSKVYKGLTPICIAMLIQLSGCDPGDTKLTLLNNTNDTIYFALSFRNESFDYPIHKKDREDYLRYSNFIEPHHEQHQVVMDSWEHFINEALSDSSITLFFFTNHLIRTASRDSILIHQLYSKKVKLQVRDLEKLNWRVEFP